MAASKDEIGTTATTGSSTGKKIGLIVLGLLIAFGAGFLPQWWAKRQVQQELMRIKG